MSLTWLMKIDQVMQHVQEKYPHENIAEIL